MLLKSTYFKNPQPRFLVNLRALISVWTSEEKVICGTPVPSGHFGKFLKLQHPTNGKSTASEVMFEKGPHRIRK
jgi:hypothetical protein